MIVHRPLVSEPLPRRSHLIHPPRVERRDVVALVLLMLLIVALAWLTA